MFKAELSKKSSPLTSMLFDINVYSQHYIPIEIPMTYFFSCLVIALKAISYTLRSYYKPVI